MEFFFLKSTDSIIFLQEKHYHIRSNYLQFNTDSLHNCQLAYWLLNQFANCENFMESFHVHVLMYK